MSESKDPHRQEFEPITPGSGHGATNSGGPGGGGGASGGASGGGRQVRVQFNESNVDTLYANAFRTNLGNNEVFLDLGINRFLGEQAAEDADPDATPGPPIGSFRFDVSHRVAMNVTTAKQLAQHLTQVIQQIEQRGGK